MSQRKQIPSLSVIHIALLHSATSVSPYRCLVHPDGVHPEIVNKSLNHTTITTTRVMYWKYPPSFFYQCPVYSFFLSSALFSSPVNELQQGSDRGFAPGLEWTCKPLCVITTFFYSPQIKSRLSLSPVINKTEK